MRSPEDYKGREQTYLKHFILEKYVERVAYNIGWNHTSFVYIDGFSGPWRSEVEAFEDTSFMIAIRKLRQVRTSLAQHGKKPTIHCIFIEENAVAVERLREAIEDIHDIDVRVFHGSFETMLPEVIVSVREAFALTFIDPTGWTGFALDKIAPLLQRKGEVLVNFMFDHINRFRSLQEEVFQQQFDALFGGPGWNTSVKEGEVAMLRLYAERLKLKCGFKYATHTRILKPLHDRTYFYLVYATRHRKGLVEFRGVEQRFLSEQEQVRSDAKQEARIKKSGQDELFRDAAAEATTFERGRVANRERARDLLLEELRLKSPQPFEALVPLMLEVPMIALPQAKRIMSELHRDGRIHIEGMKPRQRLPDDGCSLSLA